MASVRILHVDDEPDIREVVELSLGLDPSFTVRSCGSGEDAIALAADWSPDLILCDVMMPLMDGPATLARLRECSRTANIPVIFMTARAQARELEHFKSLGAVGVIAKPFDPMTLAESVRNQFRSARLAALHDGFARRLRSDAAALATCRASLRNGAAPSTALGQIKSLAHGLVGAAGVFDFPAVSGAAEALEKAAIEALADGGALEKVEAELDALLDCINRQ